MSNMQFTPCSCACPTAAQLSTGTLAPNSANKSKAMLLAEKVRCLPGSLVVPKIVSSTPTLDAVMLQGNTASTSLDMNQYCILNCKCVVIADDKTLPNPQQMKLTSRQIQLGDLNVDTTAPSNQVLGTDNDGNLIYVSPGVPDLSSIFSDIDMHGNSIVNCKSVEIVDLENPNSGATVNSEYMFVQKDNLNHSAGCFVDALTSRAVSFVADNLNENKAQMYADDQNTVVEVDGLNASLVLKDINTLSQLKLTSQQLQLGAYPDVLGDAPSNKLLGTDTLGNLTYLTGPDLSNLADDIGMNQHSINNAASVNVTASNGAVPSVTITNNQLKLNNSTPSANKVLGTDVDGNLVYTDSIDLANITSDIDMQLYNINNIGRVQVVDDLVSPVYRNQNGSNYHYIRNLGSNVSIFNQIDLLSAQSVFTDFYGNRVIINANSLTSYVELRSYTTNSPYLFLRKSSSSINLKITEKEILLNNAATAPANKVLATDDNGYLNYKTGLTTTATTPVVNGSNLSIPIVLNNVTYYVPVYTSPP
jgi:hypothetical protein